MLHHITLRTWSSASLYKFSTTSANCRFLSQYMHTTAAIVVYYISNKDIQCRPDGESAGVGKDGTHHRDPTMLHMLLSFSILSAVIRYWRHLWPEAILPMSLFLVPLSVRSLLRVPNCPLHWSPNPLWTTALTPRSACYSRRYFQCQQGSLRVCGLYLNKPQTITKEVGQLLIKFRKLEAFGVMQRCGWYPPDIPEVPTAWHLERCRGKRKHNNLLRIFGCWTTTEVRTALNSGEPKLLLYDPSRQRQRDRERAINSTEWHWTKKIPLLLFESNTVFVCLLLLPVVLQIALSAASTWICCHPLCVRHLKSLGYDCMRVLGLTLFVFLSTAKLSCFLNISQKNTGASKWVLKNVTFSLFFWIRGLGVNFT